MNAELTCQLSDRPVPPRGGERFLRRRRACWERGVSKSVVLLTGDRWFESISLGRAALDERVLAAMRNVPGHRFVPSFLAPLAYQDTRCRSAVERAVLVVG